MYLLHERDWDDILIFSYIQAMDLFLQRFSGFLEQHYTGGPDGMVVRARGHRGEAVRKTEGTKS